MLGISKLLTQVFSALGLIYRKWQEKKMQRKQDELEADPVQFINREFGGLHNPTGKTSEAKPDSEVRR